MQNLHKIHAAIKKSKSVLIIGLPASGKTLLAKELQEIGTGHVFIGTDTEFPFSAGTSENVFNEMLDYEMQKIPVVMEGVLCYRLLRKCVENSGAWLPDLIIEVKCSEETRAQRYAIERPEKKYKSVLSFCKTQNGYLETWNNSQFSKQIPHVVYVTD